MNFGSIAKLIGSQTSRQAAKAAIPGAAMNLALGTLTGGPVAGAAYAAGDFLLNYPLVGLARKLAPGTPAMEALVKNKKGELVPKNLPYQPSHLETGVNFAASLASMPLVDAVTKGSLYSQQGVVEPTNISQEQQIYQQATQRQQINQLQAQALSPGTQFQMQGIEQTLRDPNIALGLTLPPETLALLNELA